MAPTDPLDDAAAQAVGSWLFQLNVARRACHMYALDHPATEQSKQKLLAETAKLPHQPLLLRITPGGFEIPDTDLGDAAAGGAPIARQLARLGIVAMSLKPPISDEAIIGLLAPLTGLTDRPSEADRLRVLARAGELGGIDLIPLDVDWFLFSQGLAANLGLEGGMWGDLVSLVTGGDRSRLLSPAELAKAIDESRNPREVIDRVVEGLARLLDQAATDSTFLDGLTLLAATEKMIGRLRPEVRRHAARRLLPQSHSANPLRARIVDVVPAEATIEHAAGLVDAGTHLPRPIAMRVDQIAESGGGNGGSRGSGRAASIAPETVARARDVQRKIQARAQRHVEEAPSDETPFHRQPAVRTCCEDPEETAALAAELDPHAIRRHFDLVLRSARQLWPESAASERAGDRLLGRYFERLELGEFPEAGAIARDLLATGEPVHLRRMTGVEGLEALLDAIGVWGKEHSKRVAMIAARLGDRLLPTVLDELAAEESMSRRRRLLEMVIAIGPKAIPALRQKLDGEPWYVVRNALLLLRRLKDPELGKRARTLVAHDDPRVAAEAILGLVDGKDPHWLRALHGLLGRDEPLAIKEALSVAAKVHHPEVGKLLARMVGQRRGARLREDDTLALINALGGFPQPEVAEELDRLASIANWRVPFRLTPIWEAVARAAARHDSDRGREILAKIAAQRDPAAKLARELLGQRSGGED